MDDEETGQEATTEEEDENPLTGAVARESLAGLGLSPEESQVVPDYDGTIKLFNEGDIVTGTVVKVDKEEVLLDIGYKSEGVIPARELSIRYDAKPSDLVSNGEQLEALVLQKEDKEGRLILSKKRAQYERAWGNIERLKEEGGIVEGEVIEVVKGGLILDIGLRGFLPASLVDLRRVKDLNSFLGQKLEAKIIELDKNRNNVVLSRRAYLEKQKSTERKEFLENLQKGTKCSGSVSSIVNFGAFVDLGGVDGLIHISELSWSHVDHPSEVLSVGQEINVEILDVDLERERVSLSLKKAQEDPWEMLAKDKPAGSTVHGKVTKLVPFGAFVEISPGVEGLVHISEMAWEHIEFPEEVVSVGDEVDANIIDIDLGRRRISLSLKQLAAPAEGDYRESEREAELEPQLVEAHDFTESEVVEASVEAVPEPLDRAEIASEIAMISAEVDDVEVSSAADAYLEETEVLEVEQVAAVAEPEVDAEPEEAPEPEVAAVPEAAPEPEVAVVPEAVPEPEPAPEPVPEPSEAVEEAPEAAPVEQPTDAQIEVETPPVEADSPEADGEPARVEEQQPEEDEPEAEAISEKIEVSGEGSLESILADMRKKGNQE